MDAVLRATVVPVLRARGFHGSFPHFHRVRESQVDLLQFQYSSSSGGFVVELSYADPARENIVLHGDKELPPGRLRVNHTHRRFRLGATSEGGDHWFSFERASPEAVAASVVPLIETQAEAWWAARG